MKKLSDLLKGVAVLQRVGQADVSIDNVQFDSRKVSCNTLFVAQRGTVADGHQYIGAAIEKGAVVIVAQTLPQELKDGVVYIRVEDSSYSLGLIARNFYDNPSSQLKLVGITGTNGKTTTATLSFNLFSSLGFKCGLISTIVNKIGDKDYPTERTTPDVLSLNELLSDMVASGCEFVFMEVSSHAVVQQRIAGLSFSGAVFSNITHDHLDYHKTFANYIKAKRLSSICYPKRRLP